MANDKCLTANQINILVFRSIRHKWLSTTSRNSFTEDKLPFILQCLSYGQSCMQFVIYGNDYDEWFCHLISNSFDYPAEVTNNNL